VNGLLRPKQIPLEGLDVQYTNMRHLIILLSSKTKQLTASIYFGDTERIKLLLGIGLNPADQIQIFGNALHTAAATGRSEVMQLFLDKNTNIEAQRNGDLVSTLLLIVPLLSAAEVFYGMYN
jgi:hypothetical protein